MLLVGVWMLIPLTMPVVTRETPPLVVCVAQVDTGRHDWTVHLRQMRYVGAVLRHFLSSNSIY